jgi:hypothetical protein
MVLRVASLRTGDRFVSFFGDFEFKRGSGDLTLDRSCLQEPPPGRDDSSRLCGRLRLGLLLLWDRPGEVYQLTVLSPVDDLPSPPISKNNGDRLVSTRWGELGVRERARSCRPGLSSDSLSLVLWNGIVAGFERIGVALEGVFGGLFSDNPKMSVSVEPLLGMGGGVAIERKDLSGSSGGFFCTGILQGLLQRFSPESTL